MGAPPAGRVPRRRRRRGRSAPSRRRRARRPDRPCHPVRSSVPRTRLREATTAGGRVARAAEHRRDERQRRKDEDKEVTADTSHCADGAPACSPAGHARLICVDWLCSCRVLQPDGGDPPARALEVRDGDGVISLPRRQQRALLAALALRAGEVVSTDRLVADLWGERAPASATGLQNTVSALRKLVGRDVVVTQAPGYRLAVPREAVDSHRFERFVNEARAAEPAARARLLREALDLLARAGARRPRGGGVRPARGLAPARAAGGGAGGADRRRARARTARGARRRAGAARRGPSSARAAARPADARALPLRPPGGSARGLSGGPARARRRALARPSPELQELERKVLRQDPARGARSSPRNRPRERSRSCGS